MKKYYLSIVLRFWVMVAILLPAIVNSQVTIDFMQFNVWQEGTSVSNGLNKIRDVIIEADPDIVSFVEVRNYNNEDWTTKIVNALSTAGYEYNGVFAGGDVSLISKYPITGSELVYSGEGSVVKFDVSVADTTIVVAAAHLDYTWYACYLPRGYNGGYPNWEMIDDGTGNPDPVLDTAYILEYNLNSERDEQIAAFLNSVQNETRPVVLMGDFNEPSFADWSENNSEMFDHHGLVIPWQNVQSLVENGFIDSYREYFSDETTNPGITWPSYADGVGSTSWTPLADERDRIDFILYNGEEIETVYAALVGPRVSYAYNQPDTSYTSYENFIADNLPWPSDHKAVLTTLKFSSITGTEEEQDDFGITIFPNPVHNIVNVITDKVYKSLKVKISTIEGKTVLLSKFQDKKSVAVDIRDLAKGVYLITVSSDRKDIKKKIVVE